MITPPIISATDVATVQRSEDPSDVHSLTVNLTSSGSKKLAAATAKPAGMRIAFVVNGAVMAAPALKVPLSSGFRITGHGISDNREGLFEALTKRP
ncbi:MAG: hypothetical protein R3C02_21585 [Planctomycetaceae bacterium]